MFSSKKNQKRTTELDSLVGANTKLIGDVHFSGGLHIDGTIEGNVLAEGEDSMVTTSEKACIRGNVHVHSMVLSGEVIGDVYALKHIELAPNARVTGNVYYNLIEMAGGAAVNGSLIHYQSKDGKLNEPAANKTTPVESAVAVSEPPLSDTTESETALSEPAETSADQSEPVISQSSLSSAYADSETDQSEPVISSSALSESAESAPEQQENNKDSVSESVQDMIHNRAQGGYN